MSRIENIGKRLYGDSWQAQIARDLKNAEGESIARQTVQSWHNRNILPAWAKEQLQIIAEQRQIDIAKAIELLND